MRIIYDNYISTDTTIEPYSEDGNYLVSNIYDTRLSRVYRTDGVASTEYIIFEQTCAANYMVVVNHNVSSSATIYVEACSSSGFGACFSTTMPWNEDSMYAYVTPSTSNAFWRLRIVGNSTTQAYIEIGYMFLSTYIEMPGMKPDQAITDETTARVTYSDGGQAYGDDGYNYRAPKFNFPYLTNDQRLAVRDMWETVKTYKPVYVIIWPGSTSEEAPMYCNIEQKNIEWKRTDDVNYRWATSIQFREIF